MDEQINGEGSIDGWMDERIKRWMNGWVVGAWMDGFEINGSMEGSIDGSVDGWKHMNMNEWYGWVDEWINGSTK